MRRFSFIFVPLRSYNSSIPFFYEDYHPYSRHSHPKFPAYLSFPPYSPHSHHSHPDFPHSHYSPHSAPRFLIPAFTDSLEKLSKLAL